jgi:endoglucanase
MRRLTTGLGVLAGVIAVTLVMSGCQRKATPGASNPGNSEGASKPAGGNLIKNADFESGAAVPWSSSFSPPASGSLGVREGAACLTINEGGVNKWDAQIRHREMVIQNEHTYNVSFKIWADKPTRVSTKVGMSVEPYSDHWTEVTEVTSEPQLIRGGFVMDKADDPTAEFALHLGGNLLNGVALPVTICIDDVFMTDAQFTPAPVERAAPLRGLRVNQVGYFPGGKKIASVLSTEASPLAWRLEQGGKVVAEGKTKPFGLDPDSGDSLQLIDFSSFSIEGTAFTLHVGDATSAPFEIGSALYSKMKYDALRYFYHNRSGIEIKMPYSGGEQWARPAGHAESDKKVPCGQDFGCDYTLDVSKGWYDAGDHGKYVVNGGISVWTMMNQFERFSAAGSDAAFGDGKLNIPEGGNGVPDILDEARWQMEFMLGMQVPDGKKHAGMVHHKMHDTTWSGLGLAPHEAEKQKQRNLRPVSTAATLNVAATAAQASRLFQKYDAGFAARCLKAAEKAWMAAKKEPAIYADPKDSSNGGGPYNDADVSDEFFWAAAELYITTKKPAYKKEMEASPFYKKLTTETGGVPTSMTWANTDALGTLSLTTVKGALGAPATNAQKAKILDAADKYLKVMDAQGYRLPFNAAKVEGYPWGSNSFVINNLMILGFAYDFSQKEKYLEGMTVGMDYLLGRNAMDQSYVSGYGARPLQNPHHRFWAKQANPNYPAAPPGALSGGPNSQLQDPQARAEGLTGCKPQRCFVDHIEAWSVNEITINWNAPFAWVTAYLDENGPRGKSAPETN